jgi:hypothetical protein
MCNLNSGCSFEHREQQLAPPLLGMLVTLRNKLPMLSVILLGEFPFLMLRLPTLLEPTRTITRSSLRPTLLHPPIPQLLVSYTSTCGLPTQSFLVRFMSVGITQLPLMNLR